MPCATSCPGKGTCSGKCRALGRVGDLCRSGMSALQTGDHGVAERVLRYALEMTREYELGPVLEAKAANSMGLVLQAQGRVAEAMEEFQRALRLIDARIGTENQLYRTILGNYQQVLASRLGNMASVEDIPNRNNEQARFLPLAPEGSPCRN